MKKKGGIPEKHGTFGERDEYVRKNFQDERCLRLSVPMVCAVPDCD